MCCRRALGLVPFGGVSLGLARQRFQWRFASFDVVSHTHTTPPPPPRAASRPGALHHGKETMETEGEAGISGHSTAGRRGREPLKEDEERDDGVEIAQPPQAFSNRFWPSTPSNTRTKTTVNYPALESHAHALSFSAGFKKSVPIRAPALPFILPLQPQTPIPPRPKQKTHIPHHRDSLLRGSYRTQWPLRTPVSSPAPHSLSFLSRPPLPHGEGGCLPCESSAAPSPATRSSPIPFTKA